MNITIAEICQRSGDVGPDYLQLHHHNPLDFFKPLPDPKSLITPFWFGLDSVLRPSAGQSKTDEKLSPPAKTFPDSRVLPQNGISTALMIYTLLFQIAYFGLHIGFA